MESPPQDPDFVEYSGGSTANVWFRDLDSSQTDEMKAYYFDNAEGDQRLPHFDGRPVDEKTLERLGFKYWFIPIDKDGN